MGNEAKFRRILAEREQRVAELKSELLELELDEQQVELELGDEHVVSLHREASPGGDGAAVLQLSEAERPAGGSFRQDTNSMPRSAASQRQAFSAGLPVAHEDLTTESLLELLRVHPESEFWQAIANAAALQLVNSRQNRSGTADAAGNAFLELTAEDRVALSREHALVRRAVKSVTSRHFQNSGNATSELEQEEDDEEAHPLSCAADLAGGSGETEQLGSELSKGSIQEALRETWEGLKRDFVDLAYFFTQFVRWEIQVSIYGSTSIGIPQVAWKCQPLMACLKEIFKLPLKFKQLLTTLVWGIFRIGKAIVKAIASFITGGGGAERPRDEIIAELERTGEVPTRQQVLEEVEARHVQLYSDYATWAGSCAPCAGRLKGVFAITPATLALVGATPFGLISLIQISVATVPAPLSTLRGCTSCLWKWREDLYSLFTGYSSSDTERYFSPGQCNPHAMGMCMMLEKVRSCRFKVDSGASIEQDDKEDAGHEAQKEFCEIFSGTKLRLTKMEGRTRCPEVVQGEYYESNSKVLRFNEKEVTTLGLARGCHLVRKTLKRYNQVCERTGSDSMGFSDWLKSKTGRYVYKHAAEPGNSSEVATKCRKLFNCVEKDLNAPKQSRVNWDELQSALRAIIVRVDDLRDSPATVSPEAAAAEVVKLLDQSSKEISLFEGKVQQKVEVITNHNQDLLHYWGSDLESVFDEDVWDDRCFSGLSNEVNLWRQSQPGFLGGDLAHLSEKTKLAGLYKRLGRTTLPKSYEEGDAFKFFRTLAEALGSWTWSGPTKCVAESHENKRPVTARVPIFEELGPVARLLVLNRVADDGSKVGWEQEWEMGEVNFRSLGLGAERKMTLRRYAHKEGHWYLHFCVGKICGGAEKGNRLKRITMRSARGPEIKVFRERAFRFVRALQRSDEIFTMRGGGDENPGFPMEGRTSFQRAVAFFQSAREYMMNEDVDAGTAVSADQLQLSEDKVRHFVRRGSYTELHDLVEGAPDLKTFFDARSWSLEKVRETNNGEPVWEMKLHGKELTMLSELDSVIHLLKHSHWQASVQARDSILEFGEAILGNAHKTVLYEALPVRNTGPEHPNPFTILRMNDIYQECSLATDFTCFDHGLSLTKIEFFDPTTDELPLD